MKVLITGGAGFIGYHAASKMRALGHEIILLDNFNSFYDPSLKRRNVQEAFIGEPAGDPTQPLDNYADGDEAVDIAVRGGKVQLLVPAGTPDDKVLMHIRLWVASLCSKMAES